MITDFFVSTLHGIAVNDVWVKQNDVTCDTCHATIELLRQTFEDRLINRNGHVN